MGGKGSGRARESVQDKIIAGTFDPGRHAALTRRQRSGPPPRAPNGLTKEGRQVWRAVNARWELNTTETQVLLRALENLKRMRQAETELACRTSLYYEDAKGIIREHPAVMTEHRARQAFTAAWKLLGLSEGNTVLPPEAPEDDDLD